MDDKAAREHLATPLDGTAAPAAMLIPLYSDSDVLLARQQGRALAGRLHFSGAELTEIATAISEVARNIVEHAGQGEVALHVEQRDGRRSLVVRARDQGPGIVDVHLAMQPGYSTRKGLGLGLPGARQLMDEFTIVSKPGKGTLISMRKWEPRGAHQHEQR